MEQSTIAIYILITFVIILLTYVFVYKKNSDKLMDQLAVLAFWRTDDDDEGDDDVCDDDDDDEVCEEDNEDED